MKNFVTTLLVLSSLTVLGQEKQLKAFEKGRIYVDAGIGFGINALNFNSTYEKSATVSAEGVALGINPSDLNHKSTDDTTMKKESFIIPISIEYGISHKIGIGYDMTISNYFLDAEEKVVTKSVKAYDVGPKVSYHPLKSSFYDLSLGLGVGFSKIVITEAAKNNPKDFSSPGFYLNVNIKNNFWFSKHIGAYINLGYKGIFYPAYGIDTSKEEEAELKKLPYVSNVKIKNESNLSLNGVNLGVGLALRF